MRPFGHRQAHNCRLGLKRLQNDLALISTGTGLLFMAGSTVNGCYLICFGQQSGLLNPNNTALMPFLGCFLVACPDLASPAIPTSIACQEYATRVRLPAVFLIPNFVVTTGTMQRPHTPASQDSYLKLCIVQQHCSERMTMGSWQGAATDLRLQPDGPSPLTQCCAAAMWNDQSCDQTWAQSLYGLALCEAHTYQVDPTGRQTVSG